MACPCPTTRYGRPPRSTRSAWTSSSPSSTSAPAPTSSPPSSPSTTDPESRAINRYIATKYKETGLDLLPADISAAAAVEVWLEVESHQFGNPAGDLVFQLLVLPMVGGTTDQAVVEKQSEKLAKVLDVYEARLGENKYLAGGEFTLADLNHLPCMYLLLKTGKADLITARPHVNAWFEDISSRPAWKKTAAGIPL